MDDVLDPYHIRLTQEDENLFNEKQKFMHFVFSTTLKTDRGKKFVRENEDDFDAKIVCKKLHGFYTTSVGARVSESGMLSWITSEKFESWKGTTEHFILNSQDQVRLCEL